jgi:hypothetical protein
MTSTSSEDEIEFQLRKALLQYSDEISGSHRWLWEVERWKELIFSLLNRALPLSSTMIRHAIASLAPLGLLEINAALTGPEHTLRERRLTEVLLDLGWNDENAARAFAIIREAGQGLEKHFGGKVQLALRKYAELMLTELSDTFAFTALDEAATRDALTLWLQNVADLPVSLRTQDLTDFCQRYGVDELTVIRVADSIDVNLALLDDVLASHARATTRD